MMNKPADNKGFSLIEVIAVLILTGIIGSMWGLGIIQIVNGFMLAKQNTEHAQKAQMVMTRLIKEFQSAEYITPLLPPSTPQAVHTITYSRNPDDFTDTYTVSFDNGIIEIKHNKPGEPADILADKVNVFSLEYYKDYKDYDVNSLLAPSEILIPPDTWEVKMIKINLEFEGIDNTSSKFNTCVFLRGLF